MGHLVFTLRLWACVLWACVVWNCLLPQTVQGVSDESDADKLLNFRDKTKQSAMWDAWNVSDGNAPCGWIGVSCISDQQVQGLHFSGWGLRDTDFSSLGSLKSLKELDLSSNKFTSVPDVSSLIGLTSLDLSGNQLFPISQSSPTTVYNKWDISATNFSSLRVLQYLNLVGSNIVGSFPSLDGLVELKVLSLSGNQLPGSIPELRNLTNLVSLDLGDNQLTGGIPKLEGLTRLVHLSLANNYLTGDIPNMEALPRLRNLYLGGNNLTGFSESGFRSTSLKIVDISRNQLEGRIPDGAGQMPNLQTLDLSWNNLTGPIPSGLGNVSYMDLSNNMLSGNIPQDIRNDSNSQWCYQVDLSANQLTRSIPESLISAQCCYLNLSGNFLAGTLPEANTSRYLMSLDLSNNLLEGPFPFSISNSFGRLRLGRNRLSGDFIEYLTMVLTAHPWSTPVWLEIFVRGNQFTGDIAALLPALKGGYLLNHTLFHTLDLSYNSLKMTAQDFNPLQAMLQDPHMVNLGELRLAGNNLTGISLPHTLEWSLPSLRILDLSDSFLEGEMTEELFTGIGNLTQFRVSMNRLSGKIPAKLPGSLQVLEIGHNNLEGEIPDVLDGNFSGLSSLTSLLVFNASNNRLGGRIPATLPRGLQVLDLSGNNFSGEIPGDLFFRLPNLTFFNVSNNRLSGRIPNGLNVSAFTSSSFANNPGLCGEPLPACSRERPWVLVVVAAALLVSMGSCLLLVWKWRRYSKKHEQDADLIAIILKRALAITLMPLLDLQRATNNFSQSFQIGEGGGGTVYLGKLKDGTNVAIKTCKHKEGRQEDKHQFLNEVEILSRVHHRHLVKLLGCSMENNKAALVFEYVPNGTLEEHLRGRMEGALSWKQRLLIALQTSDALAYLHSAADPPIFHTDVKSSNILLDEDLNAKVTDFGISKLAPMGATHVSTMGIQGTFGYMDPEYFQTSQLTAKSDVYSFGVVLLELISGKSPRDMLWASGEASLVDLVFSVMKHGDWERLFDPCLLDILNTPTGKASIHSTCALATQCLAKRSPERPEMKEVRKRLQTLWVQYEACFDDVKELPLKYPRVHRTTVPC